MSTRQSKILGLVEKLVLFGLLMAAVLGGAIYGLIVSEVEGRSELQMLANYRPSTPTRLYDRNGEVFAELYRHRQELVTLSDIPPHVIQAFLAVEDDNFFNHFGIDIAGIIRAALKNIAAGRIVQGGSTLTQQLAKQIYLNAEGKRGRTFTQKIRETVLALQIEEELSKEEILEVFFNVIYLGHGCQGIACASRLYFDKRVQDLTLAEGALLARLPKSPIGYSPYKYPRNSKKQHMFVLNRMADQGYIPANQIDRIHNKFWNRYWDKVIVESPSRSQWGQRLNEAPYFTDYVRQILEAAPEIGDERLYRHGLKVYTTLDMNHQRIVESEMGKMLVKANRIGQAYAKSGGRGGVDFSLFGIHRSLSLLLPVGGPISKGLDLRGQFRKEVESEMLDGMQALTYLTPANNEAAAFEEFRKDTYTYTSNLQVQGAFISIEPRSGYITSMMGGTDFSPTNQYNRVLRARRQPGSAFKIFVYGGAIESRSMTSTTPINDAPFFTIAPDGSSWAPANYDQGFMGLVPAKRALAASLNTAAVQVYFRVGPEPIIDLASRLMKVSDTTRFTPDPALALGASEVTPMELTTAVSIIANGGRDVIPFGVRYVTDQSGNVMYGQESRIRKILAIKSRENTIQVIEPGLAYILQDMLHGVAKAGTATGGLRLDGGFHGDIAVKTGTTSNYSDAWITGFNPEYASTVWFGFDKSSVTLGHGQAGGGIGAPVIGAIYRRIYKEQNLPYPRFEDTPLWKNPPSDIEPAGCGGFGMGPKEVDGYILRSPRDGSCGGDRILDERKLLMEEMGISTEELGVEGRLRFKTNE